MAYRALTIHVIDSDTCAVNCRQFETHVLSVSRLGRAGFLVQWLKLLAWKVGGRGFKPHSGIQVSREQNVSSQLTRKRFNIVESLRDREVANTASDRQGSNFESCVWRAVSSHLSDHSREVLLAQFSLYVHRKGPETPFISFAGCSIHRDRCPANTTRWNNTVLMLGQRLRRWPNIKTALFQRVVFAGYNAEPLLA